MQTHPAPPAPPTGRRMTTTEHPVFYELGVVIGTAIVAVRSVIRLTRSPARPRS